MYASAWEKRLWVSQVYTNDRTNTAFFIEPLRALCTASPSVPIGEQGSAECKSHRKTLTAAQRTDMPHRLLLSARSFLEQKPQVLAQALE
jgi:hypothetical protein